uniref:Alphavirus-like MT domain-containing protein n=1 Tax=Riboviria sp. TaxID=2585031 RepID=A0A8K1U415_9VIRU|nr:MAG: hypothetical protein 2 [Riboviria sp.]
MTQAVAFTCLMGVFGLLVATTRSRIASVLFLGLMMLLDWIWIETIVSRVLDDTMRIWLANGTDDAYEGTVFRGIAMRRQVFCGQHEAVKRTDDWVDWATGGAVRLLHSEYSTCQLLQEYPAFRSDPPATWRGIAWLYATVCQLPGTLLSATLWFVVLATFGGLSLTVLLSAAMYYIWRACAQTVVIVKTNIPPESASKLREWLALELSPFAPTPTGTNPHWALAAERSFIQKVFQKFLLSRFARIRDIGGSTKRARNLGTKLHVCNPCLDALDNVRHDASVIQNEVCGNKAELCPSRFRLPFAMAIHSMYYLDQDAIVAAVTGPTLVALHRFSGTSGTLRAENGDIQASWSIENNEVVMSPVGGTEYRHPNLKLKQNGSIVTNGGAVCYEHVGQLVNSHIYLMQPVNGSYRTDDRRNLVITPIKTAHTLTHGTAFRRATDWVVQVDGNSYLAPAAIIEHVASQSVKQLASVDTLGFRASVSSWLVSLLKSKGHDDLLQVTDQLIELVTQRCQEIYSDFANVQVAYPENYKDMWYPMRKLTDLQMQWRLRSVRNTFGRLENAMRTVAPYKFNECTYHTTYEAIVRHVPGEVEQTGTPNDRPFQAAGPANDAGSNHQRERGASGNNHEQSRVGGTPSNQPRTGNGSPPRGQQGAGASNSRTNIGPPPQRGVRPFNSPPVAQAPSPARVIAPAERGQSVYMFMSEDDASSVDSAAVPSRPVSVASSSSRDDVHG